jgi:hypothetical protein
MIIQISGDMNGPLRDTHSSKEMLMLVHAEFQTLFKKAICIVLATVPGLSVNA